MAPFSVNRFKPKGSLVMAKFIDRLRFWRLDEIVAACPFSIGLTYLSAFVPGSVIAVCGDVGDGPVFCPVAAYGLPLPYIVDNPALSPSPTVSRNPIWMLVGEDHLLLPQLGLSFLSSLAIVLLGRHLWRRWRVNRTSFLSRGNSN